MLGIDCCWWWQWGERRGDGVQDTNMRYACTNVHVCTLYLWKGYIWAVQYGQFNMGSSFHSQAYFSRGELGDIVYMYMYNVPLLYVPGVSTMYVCEKLPVPLFHFFDKFISGEGSLDRKYKVLDDVIGAVNVQQSSDNDG